MPDAVGDLPASAIHRRRMIRRYTDRDVDPAVVADLLDAARRAPSPHNRQPWRFAVLRGDARVRLARAMGDQLRIDSQRDNLPLEAVERDVARSFERITSAPVSVLACLSMQEMDVYLDDRRASAERWMAVQAVAVAVQNILLRATELRLGACWMCAPLFCQAVVRSSLRLPQDWEPQALITVGYPADDGRDRPRKPLDEVVVYVSS